MFALYLVLALVGWIILCLALMKKVNEYIGLAAILFTCHFTAAWLREQANVSYDFTWTVCIVGIFGFMSIEVIRSQRRLRRSSSDD